MQTIEQLLEGLGQTLTEATGSTYANAGFRIVDAIKASIKSNGLYRTGNLYKSVGFALVGDSLAISMADYGYYQNFGVQGHDGNSVDPVTFGLQPKSGNIFKFNPSVTEELEERGVPDWMLQVRYFGIRPRRFLHPQDYEDILAEEFMTGRIVAYIDAAFGRNIIQL